MSPFHPKILVSKSDWTFFFQYVCTCKFFFRKNLNGRTFVCLLRFCRAVSNFHCSCKGKRYSLKFQGGLKLIFFYKVNFFGSTGFCSKTWLLPHLDFVLYCKQLSL